MKKKRKKKFRKLRRGKAKIKNNNNLVILHSNIQGFQSKKVSCEQVVNIVNADIVCLNEHHLRGRNKLVLPGYF